MRFEKMDLIPRAPRQKIGRRVLNGFVRARYECVTSWKARYCVLFWLRAGRVAQGTGRAQLAGFAEENALRRSLGGEHAPGLESG